MADATCRFCAHPLDGRSKRFCTKCLPPYGEWDDHRAYQRRYNLLLAAIGEHPAWQVAPSSKWPRRTPGVRSTVCAYQECSEVFTAPGHTKFCSNECRRLADYLRRTGQIKPPPDAVRLCVCRWCFNEFEGKSDFCSSGCRSFMKRHLKTHRSPNSCPLPVCLDCCQVFGASPWGTGDWTDGNRCWSCLSVNGAAGRRRRQAKRYGDQVTIDKLIERDGHAPCHLCDESIHYEDRGGSWGPSVDHLVPLSEGGDDTLENTALAHKWCNSVRNTRPIAEVRALLTQ